MISQSGCLRWGATFQAAVLATQIVITLEELGLRVERRAALGETPRLAMQWHHVLANGAIEPFEPGSRNLIERDQLL